MLAVVSIVYGACLALVQDDIKKIIAYSSISHLGYVMLGLLSLELVGIQGAVIQMVSHGLVAGGLFLMVGMIYERCHTRELAAYGGLAKLLPVYSVFFMILTLASVGLPTTSGFTGEFLVLLGAFKAAWPQYVLGITSLPLVLAVVAVSGVVLGALYMLRFALDLPVRRGQGAAPQRAPSAVRPERAREDDPRPDRRGRLRPRPVPRRTDAQDRTGRQGLQATGQHAAPAREPAMISHAVLTAMLPEHLLLLGIVLLVWLEIAGRWQRASLAVALLCVAAAALAAARLSLDGYAAAPFAGHFSVDPATLMAKAMVLALALPVLLMSRDEFADGEFPVLLLSSLYGVCLMQSADSMPDAVPRPRDHVAAGLRAGAAGLPPAAERRGGAEVPGARRHRDRHLPDGRVAALRRQRVDVDRHLRQRAGLGRHDGARGGRCW